MKKNSLLKELSLVVAILSILIFAGCTKPKTPPTPKVKAPVIHLNGVIADTLNYGDSTSFSWVVSGKDLTVVLNGKAVKASETFSTGRLLANKTYKLFATNDGGTVDSTFYIKVGDWTTSTYGIISHKHWIFGSYAEKGYSTNNLWLILTKEETNPAEYTIAYYFSPNGVWQIKNRITSKLITSGNWDIKGDSLIYKEGYHALILQAKEDTFAIETSNYVTDPDGKSRLYYLKTTYIRDTTK